MNTTDHFSSSKSIYKPQLERNRWLVLGCGETVLQFAETFLNHYAQARLIILCEQQEQWSDRILDRRISLCHLKEFDAWSRQPWSGILIATEFEFAEAYLRPLMQLRLQNIPVYTLPEFCETVWQKVPPTLIQHSWFLSNTGFQLIYQRTIFRVKRCFDVVAASLLLLILFPLLFIVALAIKLESPGAILYRQTRTGFNHRTFQVLKFRSMHTNAEQYGAVWASEQDPRVTRLGRWLRLMRIDELPQLWNVIRGEMSLIGPRPERPEFDHQLVQAIPHYYTRYLVKPGITGWAQVKYPYGASVEDAHEKLAYDLYYIKNYSLKLDLAIALRTIQVVLLGKGR